MIDTEPTAKRVQRRSWCGPAKATILLLSCAGPVTVGGVAWATGLDPRGGMLSMLAWNLLPYLALLTLARRFRARIRASMALLMGSTLIAALGMLTFLAVLASAGGRRGDVQADLWLIVFPILQWCEIGVMSRSLLARCGPRSVNAPAMEDRIDVRDATAILEAPAPELATREERRVSLAELTSRWLRSSSH